MLSNNNHTQVIHMDYILESIKQKRIFNSITRNVKLQQNNDDMHRIMNPRLSNFLYDSKVIGKVYLKIRDVLVSRILDDRIEEAEKQGTRVLIIEGSEIQNLNALNKMDMVIMIDTPYHVRLDRVSKRDVFTDKEILVKRDKRLRNDKRKILESKKDLLVIKNSGDINELQEKSQEILKQIEELELSTEKKFRKRLHLPDSVKDIIHKEGEIERKDVKKFQKDR